MAVIISPFFSPPASAGLPFLTPSTANPLSPEPTISGIIPRLILYPREVLSSLLPASLNVKGFVVLATAFIIL